MNATVILADDERLIRQSLVGLLEANGYDVRAGKNGEEALRHGAGDVVALREREVALLRWFAGHPGEVFTRDFLFAKFWGVSFDGNDSTLSIAILRLREKLGESAAGLKAVRGTGYVWRP